MIVCFCPTHTLILWEALITAPFHNLSTKKSILSITHTHIYTLCPVVSLLYIFIFFYNIYYYICICIALAFHGKKIMHKKMPCIDGFMALPLVAAHYLSFINILNNAIKNIVAWYYTSKVQNQCLILKCFLSLKWFEIIFWIKKNPFDFSLWGKSCDFCKLHFFLDFGTLLRITILS